MRKTPSVQISDSERRALEIASYRPRVRQAGEAMPSACDLFKRPVYVAARDTSDGRRVAL